MESPKKSAMDKTDFKKEDKIATEVAGAAAESENPAGLFQVRLLDSDNSNHFTFSIARCFHLQMVMICS
jgi:hypothetical protein